MENEQGSSHLTRRVRRVRKLAEPRRVRLGSWNIGSMTRKLRGLVDATARRGVDILCVQETKWRGQKAKEVEDTCFKLWYTGTAATYDSRWYFPKEDRMIQHSRGKYFPQL